jgi:hypothetical protein
MDFRVYNQVGSRPRIPLLIKQSYNNIIDLPLSIYTVIRFILLHQHLTNNQSLSHSTKCSQWSCHLSRVPPLPNQAPRHPLAQSSKNTSWTLKTSKTLMQSQSLLRCHLQSLPHHRKCSRLLCQVSWSLSLPAKERDTDTIQGYLILRGNCRRFWCRKWTSSSRSLVWRMCFLLDLHQYPARRSPLSWR